MEKEDIIKAGLKEFKGTSPKPADIARWVVKQPGITNTTEADYIIKQIYIKS